MIIRNEERFKKKSLLSGLVCWGYDPPTVDKQMNMSSKVIGHQAKFEHNATSRNNQEPRMIQNEKS